MRKLIEWLQPRTVLSDEEYALALAAVKFTDAEVGAITAPSLVLFGAGTVVADPNLLRPGLVDTSGLHRQP
nr:hypothetical protein [Rhodococcus sp. 06-1059B-a]